MKSIPEYLLAGHRDLLWRQRFGGSRNCAWGSGGTPCPVPRLRGVSHFSKIGFWEIAPPVDRRYSVGGAAPGADVESLTLPRALESRCCHAIVAKPFVERGNTLLAWKTRLQGDGRNRIVLARSRSRYRPAFLITWVRGCLAARVSCVILRWFAVGTFGSIEALGNLQQQGK
ncbi:hypothetical protein [Mycobacterium colombiense]|uniref:hypothetical protein n=1 Tax=Mycobacterium colombiense TaxID=339268 RepID=UPI0012DB4AF5|nr:hypothetical protein [Mycobacterium colombiense]